MQCMRLVLNIPREEFNMYDEAKSIDEASEIFKTLYENEMLERGEHFISPEQEFWGHCSNIQAWVENSYDTRLLHSNLAFSLLKKLVNIGDPLAKKGFKDEIINRLEEGNGTVVGFLIETGLLRSLSREELNDLSNSLESPLGKLAIWGIQYELPVSYYRCLDRLKHNIGLVKLGIDNNAPSSFYDRIDLLETNLELATLGVQNKAPWIFFEDFDKFKQDIEITKLGLLNRAPRSFYENYDRLKENPELAKIGVQNSAPKSFYENFGYNYF